MSSLNFFKTNIVDSSKIIFTFFASQYSKCNRIPVFIGLFVISIYCLFSSDTAYAQTAPDLKATIQVSTGEDGHILNDTDYASKLDLRANTTITIQSSSPIYGLYLFWNKPANEWTLKSGEKVTTYGQYEMLHEYVKVEQPSPTITMTIPTDGAILCEIQLFGEGDIPSNVQTWLPPCETADILLFPTHAGDESLVFGGTIPYYAGELGRKVQVSYIVRHYPDEVYREHEKLDALWAMGLRNYPVMGKFEDKLTSGHVTPASRYDYDAVLEYIVTQIRRFKPLVVLGHDLQGEYGHGLHIVSAEAVSQSMKFAPDKTYHIASADQYGLWEQSKTYLHLYKTNSIHMNWTTKLSKFNGKTALELAKAGFKCNDSQQWTNFEVSDTGSYNCADFGLYLSSVGPDKKGADFLENIIPYGEKKNISDKPTTSTEKLNADISDVEDTASSPAESVPNSNPAAESAPNESSSSASNQSKSFEQSYIDIEPLVLKVGFIGMMIVAAASFLSLFIRKDN